MCSPQPKQNSSTTLSPISFHQYDNHDASYDRGQYLSPRSIKAAAQTHFSRNVLAVFYDRHLKLINEESAGESNKLLPRE